MTRLLDNLRIGASGAPLDDREAVRLFEDLYRDNYRKILAYARRRTYSMDDADDVTAAVFAVAWRRLDDLVGADQPLAWLYGVAYRTVLSQRRGVKRSGQLAEKAARSTTQTVDLTEVTVEARDRLERATAAAATLSAQDQEILRLAGWEELSHSEIAEIMGISRGLVRTRLLRARRRLTAAYERLGGHATQGGGQS